MTFRVYEFILFFAIIMCLFCEKRVSAKRQQAFEDLSQAQQQEYLKKQFTFNTYADAGWFDGFTYRQFRRAMNDWGLPGNFFHVGHVVPDPRKKGPGASHDWEDRGHNLFAQEAGQNRRLGHKQVPCSWATRVGRNQVFCDIDE
jgi:hypothetical protein